MGGWSEGIWKWGDLGISGTAFLEPGIALDYSILRNLLESFGGFQEGKDLVEWSLDSEKGFTVSSCYSIYAQKRIPFGPFNRHDEALELIWKVEIPFRIKSFGWRLFVNRLPTKDLLVYRGINLTSTNLKCVFCDLHLEDRDHIFFKCVVINYVWKEIAKWVDFPGWNMEDCIPFFMEWNEAWNVNNMIWNIKILIWRWSFIGDIAHPNCSFYDFVKDLVSFMS
ncbi:uncharacterized protein LOC131661813 [Vicia villosa]|uniref:uncharacterized protein LOC131661813 n=1 Tax=Vicia villosa TaxID=3911 RepID=UPI00273C02EF|nr:uncharacterized protein LOC131661813 [Vicia villosa]